METGENPISTPFLYYLVKQDRVRIRIRIMSTMSDWIWFDVDIINMQLECLDTNTVSDVGYLEHMTNLKLTIQNNFTTSHSQLQTSRSRIHN